jgi:MoaA/NifB/PqqE/SkfB family radical SAM enzyme
MNPDARVGRLPILILYPHSRCNCRCVMCDIWKVETVEEIGAEELERHAGDIAELGVRWVVLSGGEPLMHRDLFRLTRRLREWRIRTTLLTTGLLVGRLAEAIARDIDDVIVSLDGPPATHDRIRRTPRAFELLAAGVEKLHDLRADLAVAARSTVQRENCGELRATAQTARDLGLRSISFLAADVASTAFNRPEGWSAEQRDRVALDGAGLAALEREIEALIEEPPGGPGFVLESPEKLRRIALHFRAALGLAEAVAPRCNAPWVSAVVESDGTVRPCFFHRPIGSLRSHGLAEVVNGPEALAFREALDVASDPTCRRCVCSLHFTE